MQANRNDFIFKYLLVKIPVMFFIGHITHICPLKVSPEKLSIFLLVKQSRLNVGERRRKEKIGEGARRRREGGSLQLYTCTGVLKFKILQIKPSKWLGCSMQQRTSKVVSNFCFHFYFKILSLLTIQSKKCDINIFLIKNVPVCDFCLSFPSIKPSLKKINLTTVFKPFRYTNLYLINKLIISHIVINVGFKPDTFLGQSQLLF